MAEIVGLLAETFIHSGAGQTAGAIDLPVARERTTGYPYIPGSGMKGALLDAARGSGVDVKRLFGEQDNAGQLLVSDARLLLLPVRSLNSPYRWLTCPYLLERLGRDLWRSGRGTGVPAEGPAEGQVLAKGKGDLFLEERLFSIERAVPDALVAELGTLVPHEATRERLGEQLVVVTDDGFAWFAQNALPVQARNRLDEQTKVSDGLWYEEALPSDTLMYLLLGDRASGAAASEVAELLSQRRYLQVGGNETVGHGWFAVRRRDGGAS